MKVIETYSACTDCYMYETHGAFWLVEQPIEIEKRVLAGFKVIQDQCFGLATTGKDLGISYAPCEICKCVLGGDRHELIALR